MCDEQIAKDKLRKITSLVIKFCWEMDTMIHVRDEHNGEAGIDWFKEKTTNLEELMNKFKDVLDLELPPF